MCTPRESHEPCWIQRKLLDITGLGAFLVGFETIRSLFLAKDWSFAYAALLGCLTGFLAILAIFGHQSGKSKGNFLGLTPRWFPLVPLVGYLVGIGVGLLLPLYDLLFPPRQGN